MEQVPIMQPGAAGNAVRPSPKGGEDYETQDFDSSHLCRNARPRAHRGPGPERPDGGTTSHHAGKDRGCMGGGYGVECPHRRIGTRSGGHTAVPSRGRARLCAGRRRSLRSGWSASGRFESRDCRDTPSEATPGFQEHKPDTDAEGPCRSPSCERASTSHARERRSVKTPERLGAHREWGHPPAKDQRAKRPNATRVGLLTRGGSMQPASVHPLPWAKPNDRLKALTVTILSDRKSTRLNS